jgi:hypothetical protein
METYAVVMARLDRAIQEQKARHLDVMLDGRSLPSGNDPRVKPGHDNGDSIKAQPALVHACDVTAKVVLVGHSKRHVL